MDKGFWFAMIVGVFAIGVVLGLAIFSPHNKEIQLCKDNGGTPLYTKHCSKGCYYSYQGCLAPQ